jgi:predicted metal-dependent hydrolase
MANPKTFIISGIGEVQFERSRKAKHVNISVRPFNIIRVAVPVGVPIAFAKEVAEKKADWIKHQIRNMEKAEQEYHDLVQNHEPVNIAAAKQKITGRLNELSRKHNIPFNQVFVRNQKTLWGSCSVKKNISLNIKISLLPEELMDYVILHELVHIKHHNHSKKYWQELGSIVENARALDKQLNNYKHLLII